MGRETSHRDWRKLFGSSSAFYLFIFPLRSPNFIIVSSDTKCQIVIMNVSVFVCESERVWRWHMPKSTWYNSICYRDGPCQGGLFVTHLPSPGDAREGQKERGKTNDPVKSPCKHANQTSWRYLPAERQGRCALWNPSSGLHPVCLGFSEQTNEELLLGGLWPIRQC